MPDAPRKTESEARRETAKDRARRAWRRLRGGELTPERAAASVAIGLAIGVTPLWGVHWAIVLAVCVPLRLDAGVAFLASNVSLPFIAPFITFAEIELGARLIRGAWLALEPGEVASVRLGAMAGELAAGTLALAAASAALGGMVTYGLVAAIKRRARGRGEPPSRQERE